MVFNSGTALLGDNGSFILNSNGDIILSDSISDCECCNSASGVTNTGYVIDINMAFAPPSRATARVFDIFLSGDLVNRLLVDNEDVFCASTNTLSIMAKVSGEITVNCFTTDGIGTTSGYLAIDTDGDLIQFDTLNNYVTNDDLPQTFLLASGQSMNFFIGLDDNTPYDGLGAGSNCDGLLGSDTLFGSCVVDLGYTNDQYVLKHYSSTEARIGSPTDSLSFLANSGFIDCSNTGVFIIDLISSHGINGCALSSPAVSGYTSISGPTSFHVDITESNIAELNVSADLVNSIPFPQQYTWTDGNVLVTIDTFFSEIGISKVFDSEALSFGFYDPRGEHSFLALYEDENGDTVPTTIRTTGMSKVVIS